MGDHRLFPGLREQFVQRRNYFLTLTTQRVNQFSALVRGNGHYFKRMQDHRRAANLESRIEPGVVDLSDCGLSNQGYNYSATVLIELRRLDDNDERNVLSMFAGIPMYIELRHL
jgi:hypothetical protein